MFKRDYPRLLKADMEKVSSSLAVLVEKFGISPRRKFENKNLLAEDFPLFPCLQLGLEALAELCKNNCPRLGDGDG